MAYSTVPYTNGRQSAIVYRVCKLALWVRHSPAEKGGHSPALSINKGSTENQAVECQEAKEFGSNTQARIGRAALLRFQAQGLLQGGDGHAEKELLLLGRRHE
jgi:hypothetical protein